MTNDEKFERAVGITLGHEGGYANDPDDPGGETKFGISKRSYPDLSVRDLTQAEAVEIYKRDWWDKYGYGRIDNPDLAAKIFDLAVNMGAKRAHVIIQRATMQTGGCWLELDGVLGDLSIAAINDHPDPLWVLDRVKLLAVRYYLSLRRLQYLSYQPRQSFSDSVNRALG